MRRYTKMMIMVSSLWLRSSNSLLIEMMRSLVMIKYLRKYTGNAIITRHSLQSTKRRRDEEQTKTKQTPQNTTDVTTDTRTEKNCSRGVILDRSVNYLSEGVVVGLNQFYSRGTSQTIYYARKS